MKFICFFIILITVINANAQTGCLINTSAGPKVYYQPQYTGSVLFYNGSGSVRWGNLSSCQGGNSPSNSYYVLTSSPGAACYAGYNTGPGGNTNPSNYSQSGNLVTYNVYTCPIDGYSLFALFILGGFGIYVLKFRKIICMYQTDKA